MGFWHLYTVAALIMAIVLLRRLLGGPPKPPCTHSWELVDRTDFPSCVEVWKQAGHIATPMPDHVSALLKITARKVVVVLRCPKCDHPPIVKEFTSL